MSYYNDRRYRARDEERWYNKIDERSMLALVEIPIEECECLDAPSEKTIPGFLTSRLAEDEIIVDWPNREEGEPRPDDSDRLTFYFAARCKWEVCDVCSGRGKHVNPDIDSHGITQSEMAEWGHEEREMYFSGGYDVECYGCGGKRVQPSPDLEHCSPAIQACMKKRIKDLAEIRAEEAADRRTRWYESGCPR